MPEPGMSVGLLRLVLVAPCRSRCACSTHARWGGRAGSGGRCPVTAGCGLRSCAERLESGRGRAVAGRRRGPAPSRPAPSKGPPDSRGRRRTRCGVRTRVGGAATRIGGRWMLGRAAAGGGASGSVAAQPHTKVKGVGWRHRRFGPGRWPHGLPVDDLGLGWIVGPNV